MEVEKSIGGLEEGGKKRKSSEGEEADVLPPPAKKADVHVNNSTEAPTETFESFEGFEVKAILSNSADYKRVVVEGKVRGQSAVVILDKKPFTEDVLSDLFSAASRLKSTFQNDIYGSYDCLPVEAASTIKTTVVYPATPKHIEKYVYQPFYLIDETPEIYEKVTLPYLESSSFNLQWVFNILEGKKEADRIVYKDSDPATGFILLPDLKWDGVALENLYLVAIVHQKDIKSLRELKGEHLPLLENILASGSKAIEEKYGLKRSQLRIYLHYQPSYYHLHVHFTALSFDAPGTRAEKSHLLQSVISNIQSKSSYYQEATLPFVVKKNEQIYQRLVEYGYDI